MVLEYIKKIYPGTWSRAYTPPPPPTYEVSFDTSSQYITNTITPFSVNSGTNAECVSSQTNVVTFTDGGVSTPITMQLADEWTAITSWSANWTVLGDWFSINISANTQFVPTVTHTVIHRDTQWPCPNWFHIGTKDEWQALITALTTLWAYDVNNIKTYLKIPDAYYLARSKGTKETKYWTCRFWTSTMTANNVAWAWWIDQDNKFIFQEDKPGNGFSIRPFKDSPVEPYGADWLQITTWIYWSSTLWLINISTNTPWQGGVWITISDKNLWATNVLDNWLFYQFWNNTGYTYNATPYVTSKPTLNNEYWPGNYYEGKFVRVSSWNNWFNWTNNNIWWWVTNWTWTEAA